MRKALIVGAAEVSTTGWFGRGLAPGCGAASMRMVLSDELPYPEEKSAFTMLSPFFCELFVSSFFRSGS